MFLLQCLLAACRREPLPEPECDGLVMLSLDTKAPGDPRTFRVALFDWNDEFTGRTGSYCTTTQAHTDANTGTTRTWLNPCRVNDAGTAMKDGSTEAAADLSDADTGGQWGLRWGGYASNNPSWPWNVSLAVVSPAVPVHPEPAAPSEPMYAYVNWTPGAALFISDPAGATFTGTWLDGEYVYTSSTKVPALRERRASVTVHIECGDLDEGYVQSVTLTNHITSARYYLMEKTPYARGFSYADGHFTTAGEVLYDCGAGDPQHLEKANGDYWNSAMIYFPEAAYSENSLESIRPEFIVMLGSDKAKPFKARVVLNQDLTAMTHYTLTLRISKAIVYATLTASATWDAGGTMTVLDEPSDNVGSFSLEAAWNDGGSHDATDVVTTP